jgi:hypothetical protein
MEVEGASIIKGVEAESEEEDNEKDGISKVVERYEEAMAMGGNLL